MAFRLLLQSDTFNGDTTFTDSSPDERSITVVGDSQHVTTYGSPFSGISSSMYFDGAGDRLEITVPAFSSLSSGVTIDCFAKRLSTLASIAGIGNSYPFTLLATTNMVVYFGTSTSALSGGDAGIVQNTWYHFAVCYDTVNVYLFLDGVLVATGERTAASDTNLIVGAYRNSSGTIIDYSTPISNFAIRDECVWSGSGYSIGDTVFTPPTVPYGSEPAAAYKTIQPTGPVGGSIITNLGR